MHGSMFATCHPVWFKVIPRSRMQEFPMLCMTTRETIWLKILISLLSRGSICSCFNLHFSDWQWGRTSCQGLLAIWLLFCAFPAPFSLFFIRATYEGRLCKSGHDYFDGFIFGIYILLGYCLLVNDIFHFKIPTNILLCFLNLVSTKHLLTNDYKHIDFFWNFRASALHLGTSMFSPHR